jgi:glycerol uptake facilitator-like aquaporin
MHNPLLETPVTVPPEVAQLPQNELIWRMTVNFMRKLLCELIGGCINTFWAGAIRILAVQGRTDLTGVTLEIAGMVIAILYAMAHISGGHFNTAITWAFVLRGIFPLKWAILYWTAQLVGGIIGGAFILAFFGMCETKQRNTAEQNRTEQTYTQHSQIQAAPTSTAVATCSRPWYICNKDRKRNEGQGRVATNIYTSPVPNLVFILISMLVHISTSMCISNTCCCCVLYYRQF